MSEENLSNFSKKNPGEDRTNPQSTQETGGNIQENLPPANGDLGAKSGVAVYIGELVAAGLFGTGVWILGEHLVNHGFERLGVWVNFIALAVIFSAAPITAIRIWQKPKIVWGSFCVFCLCMAVIFAATSLPEPKPHPHFTLSIVTSDAPNNPVLITNDFLRRKDFASQFDVRGMLIVPVRSEKKNIVFALSVKNDPDSPVLAEDLQTLITLPKELTCVPGAGWEAEQFGTPGYLYRGGTVAEQSWAFEFPAILPGLSRTATPFDISISLDKPIYFSILIRAKDCPAEQLTFNVMPLLFTPLKKQTNQLPYKAFFIEGKLISSEKMDLPSKQEILKNLHE